VSAIIARLRHTLDSRPHFTDVLLAVGATVLQLLGTAPHNGNFGQPTDAAAYGLAILGAAPLLLRRRFPLSTLTLITLSMGAFYALGYRGILGQPAALIALYTVCVRHPLPTALSAAGASLVTFDISVLIGRSESPIGDMVIALVQTTAAVVIGRSAGSRSQRLAEAAEKADRIEREVQLEAEKAVAEERLRIARELHDVVSHHLSVISVQANLARYVLDSTPETTRSALDTIAGTTTEALDELRRLLRVLRPPRYEPDEETEPGVYRPQPGLSDLSALASTIRDAGVPVELLVSGTVRQLPPGQQLCAYRVAQEALTNVLKHAGTTTAELCLTYHKENLTLRVTDFGERVTAPNPAGHGLIGMRERAEMYGGVIEIGRRPGVGFEIILTLPYPHAGRLVSANEPDEVGERTE
jgi:signal transduction histidine kinase